MGETDFALSSATYSNQFFSVLFVHSSGSALMVKALGQSFPVVSVLQSKWSPLSLCSYLLLKEFAGGGGKYVRIWESLSQ